MKLRHLWIFYWLLGLCHIFGHRWGHIPFWTKEIDADGWFKTPSGKVEGRICRACAALERREVVHG